MNICATVLNPLRIRAMKLEYVVVVEEAPLAALEFLGCEGGTERSALKRVPEVCEVKAKSRKSISLIVVVRLGERAGPQAK